MRILIVEDDRKAARFLRQGLQEEGHAVDVAGDGEEAARMAAVTPYDLAILDVQLPGINGLQLAWQFRRDGLAFPILMLTARDATHDVVKGLDAGADDYLTKPFAFDELLARVRALTRRPGGSHTDLLRVGDIELDRLRRTVRRGPRNIDLSPREFRLLEVFLLQPEEVITRARLLDKVWEMQFDPETNVIEAHMSNLRHKLEADGEPRVIHTIRGAGYVLRPPTRVAP